ncbi:DUF4938 domain-containing protein [Herpetosiphon geysericola]|uniref:Uncharacterized protein n=1 Tax=Herpetosiphon geysericola TaxID=70996 RepID=A0A0P6XQ84_9CHLR|nr:DUF4938 domain-containing protein [Herpetosiphon geysericola]KPL86061.1 hypothetical protein SE18_14355 [Herpetosiphon geysericola]
MSITIDHVRVLEGPNIYYPQAGVAATLQVSHDLRDEIGRQLKTWAQAVGLIIGYLRMKIEPLDEQTWQLSLSFTCNHPHLGAASLQHAVDDILAAERQDEDWSHDDALFDLRRQRMRIDPVLPLLQLRAEAQGRVIPVLPVGDGMLQLGTGSGGWRFDPAQLSLGLAVNPPWEQIRSVPLIAIGGLGAGLAAKQITQGLTAAGWQNVVHIAKGDYASVRQALVQPEAELFVVALDQADVVERGLAFNRCTIGIVLSISGLPEEQALAAGLPALTADELGNTILLADDLRTAGLARRTAAPVVQLQRTQEPASIPQPLLGLVVNQLQQLLDTGALDH